MFGETLVDRLIRDKETLEKPLRLWMTIWQEIAEVIFPRRSDIVVKQQQGAQKERRLFDSTAVSANERLAGSIAGTVTPSTSQWFEPLVPQIYNIPVPASVENYADAVGKDMFRTLQMSNFDIATQEMYQDLVAFGTGAMFISDAGSGNVHARSMQPGEYMIDADSNGEIRKVIRLLKMQVREVIKRWGMEAVAEVIRTPLESGSRELLNREVDIMHWITYRDNEPIGFPVDNFPIASIYLDVSNKHLIRKSGFYEWPCPVVRWSSTSGEPYGRGPGFTALPDVLSLNRAEELSLRAWAKAIEPPILALHDGILGQPDFRPSRINYINMEGALSYLEPKTRLDIETVKREDKRRSIWNTYYMDQVQFIPERGKTPASAEEIRARLNIMLQVLGPQLVRLEKEFLVPVLERVFGIRNRAGKLPEVPFEVVDYAKRIGNSMQVQFIGPVARAKRQAEAGVIDTFVSFVGATAQIDPQIVDVVDFDQAARERARIDQVPKKLIVPQDEVDEIRANRAKQEAQRVQMERNAMAAQTAGAAAPAMQAVMEAEQGG